MEFIERIPPWFWILIVVHFVVLGTVAYMILLERKVAAWVQDRVGPNRVGPKGLLQPMADGLKFFLKEDFRPGGVDRRLFTLAPASMIIVVIISIAIIPWGGIHQRTSTYDVTAAAAAPEVDPAEAAVARLPWGAAVVGEPEVEVISPTFIRPGVIDEPAQTLVTITWQCAFMIADLEIGVLFALAALSLAVYGVVLGGWASNNKYSFLGGLRATANMISYEIPLGLAVITVVAMFGTLNLGVIVEKQAHYWAGFIPAWNVFTQPLVFLLFLICIHAEANRAPFDMAEAEQELVGGYHTEYSSMRFALFFLAEYAGMITTSAICVALFFGGWHLPWIEWLWAGRMVDPANPAVTDSLLVALINSLVFFAKTMLVVFIFMWVRWSLPRFRFDQVMMMAWRGLIPISLLVLMVTTLLLFFFGRERMLMRIDGQLALIFILANAVMAVIIIAASYVLPPAPEVNRRVAVSGSRFTRTPLPAETPSPAAP